MNSPTLFLSLLVIFFVIYNNHCLKIIPERAEFVYKNDSYIADAILNVRRYSRKGDYVINFNYTTKVTLDNNFSVDVVFYQYLHNEFRRSFVEMHFQLCDFINKDPLVGKPLRDTGLVCPMPPAHYSCPNMTFNQNFPYVWPFEKGQVEFILRKQEELIGKGTVVMTFKQNLLKRKP